MSPRRTGPGGNFCFDRIFDGVGRIQHSSGTKKLTEYRRRDVLLTRLFEKGRLDLLQAFKGGRIGMAELVSADRLDQLGRTTADVVLRRPLWDAVNDLFPALDKGEKGARTRRRYRESLTALAGTGVLSREAAVGDLRRVDWTALERSWQKSAADWNHLRRAVSRFLTVALGDVYHPMRREIVKQLPKRRERHRVPDVTPEDFRAIVAAARPELQPAYWAIALTGARIGELLALTRADLMSRSHSVRIRASKTDTDAGDRIVPVAERLYGWMERTVPVTVTEWSVRWHWYRACEKAGYGKVRLHDLRHFTGQTLADAGRSEAAIGRFLGQTTPEITRKYTDRVLRREDAEALAAKLVPLDVP